MDHKPFENVDQLDELLSNNQPDPNDESLSTLLLDNQLAMQKVGTTDAIPSTFFYPTTTSPSSSSSRLHSRLRASCEDVNDDSLSTILLGNQVTTATGDEKSSSALHSSSSSSTSSSPTPTTRKTPDSPQSAPENTPSNKHRRQKKSPHSARSKSVLDKTELWEAKFKVLFNTL